MQLQYPDLLEQRAYIAGSWIDIDQAGASITVHDPYTGEQIANLPDCNESHFELAIQSASDAFPSWSRTPAADRARTLSRWGNLILLHEEDLAKILSWEQGKPFEEALGEIRYGASFVKWFAEEARRTYGDTLPQLTADKRFVNILQPVGVVAAITPWNFPHSMITRKLAPALAAGCTCVLKPSELTPLSALALAKLVEEAGFPGGTFNIVNTSKAEEFGKVVCADSRVRKISFTGSTRVGKQLIAQSAQTVKCMSMELGGNAPLIVFEDADLEEAVEGALASKFRNAGQTCVCANRIFVHRSLFDAFESKFTARVRELKMGYGLDSGTQVGPLINEAARSKVKSLIADALEKGAEVKCGAKFWSENEQVYEPTVLTGVNTEMRIHQEEIFGPVAPIYVFDTEEEAIEMANSTPYGLAAYFFGRDIYRIWRVAEALEYGMIGINTGLISSNQVPFGGMKESGFGREGSQYGIAEFLEIKSLCFGGLDRANT
jgi:succinate-semialdehyde dehydrogenase/glutarate-semialdehyde dehydrogenase